MPVQALRTFDYRRSLDQEAAQPVHHQVIVVGAGPVGLTAAIDLAQAGLQVVVLDDNNQLSVGSRSICLAKRTLEIFDRLGCGEALVSRGVTWNRGKVFAGDDKIYEFNLQGEAGHRRPAFINLQQYLLEGTLVDRIEALRGEGAQVELRWLQKATALENSEQGPKVTVETADGSYAMTCDALIACDGPRSTMRQSLDLDFAGRAFHDRFLIADVVMKADFPTERWFWFDPPFNPGQSALLHRQADDVWRIDLQLGPDADPDIESKPERVIPRIQAMLGAETAFDLEWVSVYTFQCRRMEHFRHGRVFFAGDSAHLVSPFGARGANGGIQDIDNLVWKLARVLRGQSPESLLDSYDAERVPAADENILNSTRATDFITPKFPISRLFRDAVLDLAREVPFARRLVNSGRLSVPAVLRGSPLNAADQGSFAVAGEAGSVAADAPLRINEQEDWLSAQLGGGFVGLYFTSAQGGIPPADQVGLEGLCDRWDLQILIVSEDKPDNTSQWPWAIDHSGLAKARHQAEKGSFFLYRPDQHLTLRMKSFEATTVERALSQATRLKEEAHD